MVGTNGQRIIIDITPAGSVSIDAQGFQGRACEQATQEIELVLGGGAVKRNPKPEYHAPATSHAGNRLTF